MPDRARTVFAALVAALAAATLGGTAGGAAAMDEPNICPISAPTANPEEACYPPGVGLGEPFERDGQRVLDDQLVGQRRSARRPVPQVRRLGRELRRRRRRQRRRGGDRRPAERGQAIRVHDPLSGDAVPGGTGTAYVEVSASAPPPPPPPPPAPPPPASPACSDGIDNDGDGRIDYPADLGCTSASDTDETNTAAPPPSLPSEYTFHVGESEVLLRPPRHTVARRRASGRRGSTITVPRARLLLRHATVRWCQERADHEQANQSVARQWLLVFARALLPTSAILSGGSARVRSPSRRWGLHLRCVHARRDRLRRGGPALLGGRTRRMSAPTLRMAAFGSLVAGGSCELWRVHGERSCGLHGGGMASPGERRRSRLAGLPPPSWSSCHRRRRPHLCPRSVEIRLTP